MNRRNLRFASNFLILFNLLFMISFRIKKGKIIKTKRFLLQNALFIFIIYFVLANTEKIASKFYDLRNFKLHEQGSKLFFWLLGFLNLGHPMIMFSYLFYIQWRKQKFIIILIENCVKLSSLISIDLNVLRLRVSKSLLFCFSLLIFTRFLFFLSFREQNLATLLSASIREWMSLAEIFILIGFISFVLFFELCVESIMEKVNEISSKIQELMSLEQLIITFERLFGRILTFFLVSTLLKVVIKVSISYIYGVV